MYTSDILDAGTVDFSRADLMAVAPSWGAETDVKAPLNYLHDNQYAMMKKYEMHDVQLQPESSSHLVCMHLGFAVCTAGQL
jgi:hypothetical protein